MVTAVARSPPGDGILSGARRTIISPTVASTIPGMTRGSSNKRAVMHQYTREVRPDVCQLASEPEELVANVVSKVG
jgi:hypothetical protein